MTPSHIIRTIVAQPAWALLLATVLAIGAAYSIYYGWLHPCAKFPGPLTCALSNAWKLFAVINEDMPDKLLELHDKYGPVVRIGPNDLSFNGADAVTAIYRRGWPKGDFYEAYQHHYPGLFDERDETLHAQRKRFVAPSLSVSAIHSMEGAMDRRYALLRGHLDRFAESGETFDLRNYIAFCISDVLGLLAFSEDFGSQEAEDLEKIPPVADALYRSALAGQVPWAADRIKKLLKSKRMLAGMRRIAPTAMKNIKLRAEGKLVRDDILGKIIVARERQESEPLHAKQLFTEATDLIVGGTDTTIQTICILFANLLRSPQHLSRVIAEADNSLPPLADGSAACALSGLEEKLDFVHAAVRESCRKNPVAAFNMPREVPVGGGEVAGYYVPSGSQVFVNLHSIHHNPKIWGEDHELYDPDRWYDGRADKSLKDLVIPFMVGKRTCTGQHLASANILKMLTTLLKAYDFKLMNASQPMVVTTHGATVLKTPILVQCKKREQVAKA